MFSDWNFFDFSPFACDPEDADMLITGAHLDAEEPVERTTKLKGNNKDCISYCLCMCVCVCVY